MVFPTSAATMTRLRRSLRGSAPEKVTQQERFERIIGYVNAGNYSETVREFNMPSYILSDFHVNRSSTTKSTLESLSPEILLKILDELDGNTQIIASLACKTLAAVAETSVIRKIANITNYKLRSSDPAIQMYWKYLRQDHDRSLSDEDVFFQWRTCGFDDDSWGAPWGYTNEQAVTLRLDIGKWLGANHRYCHLCKKFRPIQKTFWRLFAEYENPGVTKALSKEVTEKVKEAIDDWNTKSKETKAKAGLMVIVACPAHDLLEEKKGRRRIEGDKGKAKKDETNQEANEEQQQQQILKKKKLERKSHKRKRSDEEWF